MKKITFILFALIAGTSFAQEKASAIVSADIVSPMDITKKVDLNFGKVITDINGGTVIIETDGERSGTANYVTVGAAPTAAKFDITAETGYTYSIAILGTNLSGAGEEMPVNYNRISLPLSGNLGGSATELLLGGTLTVGASQLVGNYTGTVEVTVAYE